MVEIVLVNNSKQETILRKTHNVIPREINAFILLKQH